MKKWEESFAYGSLRLPNRVLYSPLAGCSDFPFRQMVARYRPGLMYCEMVKMEPLVQGDPNTYHILDFSEEMHPIGAQICGSNPRLAGPAARRIEQLGFDVVDLNCGCPVDKVTKDGSGSGLLRSPELIGEIVSEMVRSVSIPVTVKIRAGWDEETINAPRITEIVEEAGAVAIAVHGRTRQQGYRGPAVWEHIRACKEASKGIYVIGNGDVMSPELAEKMFLETGCDAVLVSRGTLGQPWIAEDILRYLGGEEKIERDVESCREALREHFEYVLKYHNDRRVCIDMRRIGCWYIKNLQYASQFRQRMSQVADVGEIRELINTFSFS